MGKRGRATSFALGAPLQTMFNVAAERATDADDEISHTTLVADLHQYDNVGSVYGTLVSEFDFQPDTSKEAIAQIQYIKPFALLHWLGAKSLPFLLFLRSCLAGMEGQMIFYADEITPGNNKRHDEGQKYVAMYCSLVEFPDWFLARHALSWFIIAYVPCKYVIGKFGMTRRLKKVFGVLFFPLESFNFEVTGVRIKHWMQEMVVKFKYRVTLADADAHRSLKAVKGSSGIKPCSSCANIMGRCGEFADVESDGSTMHFLSPEYDSFVLHTHDSVTEMVLGLQDMVDTRKTVATIKKKQVMYGISCCRDGALSDEHCRNTTRSPEDVYRDPQHCLFFSRGVAQYHINGLLRMFTANGVPIIDIVKWISYSLRDTPPTYRK